MSSDEWQNKVEELKEKYVEKCSDFEEQLENLFNSKTNVNKFTKQEKFELKLLKEKVEIYEDMVTNLEGLLK